MTGRSRRTFRYRRLALLTALALVAPPAVLGAPTATADAVVETWLPRTPKESPPVRTVPGMAYDAARQETVLFGGVGPAGNNPQRSDTWTWDGSEWTQRLVSTTPGFCPAPAMAYDAARSTTVLFCGYSATPGVSASTWTWNGSAWTHVATTVAPSPRQHYVLAYDGARGEVVLFGGRSNSGSYLNDTWTWNGTAWTLRAPASAPPGRSGASGAYDAMRQEVVVFSGTGAGSALTDTWVWNGTTWTQRTPQGAPRARWRATMAYDGPRAAAVLFGGIDATANDFLDDTWSWDGTAWSEVTTVARPLARYFAAMAFDEARAQTVLHAGAVENGFGGGKESNDTWTLDSAPSECDVTVKAPTSPMLPSVEPAADPCCQDPPTDAEGNVLLPPDATEIEEEDVSIDRGSTAALYPALATETDTWYDQVECPWAIGGEVPPLDDFTDLETQLADAGLTSTPAELFEAIDRQNEDVLLQVQRPTPVQMLDQGPIRGRCRTATTLDATPIGGLLPPPDPGTQCGDPRTLRHTKPFGGRDVIFVHGLDLEAIEGRLAGSPGFDAKWPDDKPAFMDYGFWKQRAESTWRAHILKYLKHDPTAPTSTPPPSNRYLITSWASTQWMGIGAHAVLSQIAGAMAYGEGVIKDSSGTTAGFCAQGCVVINHSTGGPITDIALAAAAGTASWPLSTLGDLTWIPERIDAAVAFSPAFSGSHYATVAAAIGWAAALTWPMCELNKLIWENVFDITIPCSRLTVVAESVLTDLAVPIMETLWRPVISRTPVPVLIVSAAHPTATGAEKLWIKAISPIVKMLFHHGLDDGVLSMDSQCAVKSNWRHAPQSFRTAPTVVDAIINGTLLGNHLPPVVVARAFDMANADRGLFLYVDQILGAQLATPEFWKALSSPATLQAHYTASLYRTASACVPGLSPTGMVQQVAGSTFLGPGLPQRIDNHYSFIMAASDHYTAARGDFASGCYEQTYGLGLDCANFPENREEIRMIDDDRVYALGLVDPAIGENVKETVKGKSIKFKWRKKPFKWWKWKRTYHRLDGWETRVAADYVYEFVLH